MKMTKDTVHIVLVTAELHIPFAHSLKEKRSVLHSLKDQLRTRFNASVAEYGYQDKWQRAMIGVCMISGDKHRLESEASRVRQLCEELSAVEIIAIDQEWL